MCYKSIGSALRKIATAAAIATATTTAVVCPKLYNPRDRKVTNWNVLNINYEFSLKTRVFLIKTVEFMLETVSSEMEKIVSGIKFYLRRS